MMIISERMLARQVELRQEIKRLRRIKCLRCAQARVRKLAKLTLSQYENANYEGVLGALADSFGITMEELPKQRDRVKEAVEASQLAKYWEKSDRRN